MSELKKIKELKKLIEESKRHKNLYYNKMPEISDSDYDELEKEITKKYTELKKNLLDFEEDIELKKNLADLKKDIKSFLNEIGVDESDVFRKEKHIIHMHSQNKVTNPKDLKEWARKKGINNFIVQHKLDGIAIELLFNKGRCVGALTRGNGIIGDQIGLNASMMEGFVLNIKEKEFTGSVRGEIILKKSKFNKIYKPQGYKNPRNMASGIAKNKNGIGCDNLSIIVFDALRVANEYSDLQKEKINTTNNFLNEKEKIEWLRNNFPYVVPTKCFENIDDVIKYYNDIGQKKDTFEINIDGLVIKDINIDLKDQKRNYPEKQIAFKWNTEKAKAILTGIEWNVHGNNYTPIAIFIPFEFMGTTIKRASLVNPDEIKRLNVDVGDLVEIKKRGEIIPKVEKVLRKNKLSTADIYPPTNCIICNTILINEGTRVYCPNKDCIGRKFRRLEKWINKLKIKGCGPKLLHYLIKNNFVKEIPDFYKVNIENVLNKTNLKKATAKVFIRLRKVKEIPLSIFISGLDIDGIGEGVIDFIVEAGIDTLEKIKNTDLKSINGIGPDRAEKLINGLKDMEDTINELLKYIKITSLKKDNLLKNKLNGQSFCFTGKMENIKRNDVQNILELNGGKFAKNVSKNTDYLVTNAPEAKTNKNIKANEFNIKVITEKQFFELINN